VAPSGLTATPNGLLPTGITLPAVPVATVIGVTVLLAWLVTYAMVPSGVNAASNGWDPTGIGVPGVFVTRSIGVIELLALLTA
jgi:hypothetical protein